MIINAFPHQQIISKLRNVRDHSNDHFIEWPNILVNAHEANYYKKTDESSLTLLLNKTGETSCMIENRIVRICTSTFFVINPYQSFEYEISVSNPVETLNIHFNYEFLQDSLYFLLHDDQTLLDMPERTSDNSIEFFNQLHYRDAGFNQLIAKELFRSKEELHTTFMNILRYLLKLEDKSRLKVHNIQSLKANVRKELFKRVCLAKDYIFSNYNQPFSLDELSREIGLSKFHFLRTFKSVYGISVYQYLKHVRLESARYYLQHTQMSISEISSRIGFEEVNSFYQAFKAFYQLTPTEFRKLAIFNSESV